MYSLPHALTNPLLLVFTCIHDIKEHKEFELHSKFASWKPLNIIIVTSIVDKSIIGHGSGHSKLTEYYKVVILQQRHLPKRLQSSYNRIELAFVEESFSIIHDVTHRSDLLAPLHLRPFSTTLALFCNDFQDAIVKCNSNFLSIFNAMYALWAGLWNDRVNETCRDK